MCFPIQTYRSAKDLRSLKVLRNSCTDRFLLYFKSKLFSVTYQPDCLVKPLLAARPGNQQQCGGAEQFTPLPGLFAGAASSVLVRLNYWVESAPRPPGAPAQSSSVFTTGPHLSSPHLLLNMAATQDTGWDFQGIILSCVHVYCLKIEGQMYYTYYCECSQHLPTSCRPLRMRSNG